MISFRPSNIPHSQSTLIPSVLRSAWLLVAILTTSNLSSNAADKATSGDPIKALLVTGGCCHNYAFQSKQLMDHVAQAAKINWTVINEGGTGTRGEIPLYQKADWAKPYDVVIHNECFADTDNPEYIRRITAAHKAGTPALVIHCAMHTYRSWKSDDWREFLGVTSRHHEHQSNYEVIPNAAEKQHPTLKGFPNRWITPKDELYIIEKVWPTTTILASSKSEKTGQSQPVIWVNNYHGTKVFGTTYGHSDDTFKDPVFLNLITQGLLWCTGKTGN